MRLPSFQFPVLSAVTLAAIALSAPETAFSQAAAINAAMPKDPAGFPSGGSVKTDAWYNLSNTTQSRPGFSEPFYGIDEDSIFDIDSPLTRGQAWLSPIRSQVSTSSSPTRAGLTKISNSDGGYTLNDLNADGTAKPDAVWDSTSTVGPYSSSKSLYNQGSTTGANMLAATLGIFEESPVADLGAIAFQMEIGPAFNYDLVNNDSSLLSKGDSFSTFQLSAISLSLNLTFGDGSTLSLDADSGFLVEKEFSHREFQPVDGQLQAFDVYIHLYDFRWDLSEYSDITAFNISFDVADHSQLYMLRLDQAAIPEPSTWMLLGLAGAAIVASRLKRRAA